MTDYKLVARIRLEADLAVASVSFTPDGRFVMTGTAGQIGMLRRWLWRADDMIEEACASVRGLLTNLALRDHLPPDDKPQACPNL